MVVNSQAFLVAFISLLATQLSSLMAADCPLDLTSSNFSLVASVCSNTTSRAKCCRYMNAFVSLSISRYANISTNLGVASDLTSTCIDSISKTMHLYGVPKTATSFCGLGTKILVKYNCKGLTTVKEMLQSPKFGHVSRHCRVPISQCRKCLNSGISYLRNLLGVESDNVTLSTCRDATYAALASRVDDASALELLGCFFQVTELSFPSDLFAPLASPEPSPSPVGAITPSNSDSLMSPNQSNIPYHLTIVPTIGIVITAISLTMLVVLVILIRRKNRELDDSESFDKKSTKSTKSSFSPWPVFKIHEDDSSPFQKFSYKEIANATNDFNRVIGQGSFGTVYKAEFSDGLIAAVKRMKKVSEQSKQDFCRKIELLATLHHRNLVDLKGFCIEKKERFLIYEFMDNGSLNDHLHSTEKPPLSWETRLKIAIDIANALEYLHFYCDPPLCHRDIKSSNILLDANFVAKLSDFGFARTSKDGSVDTNIRGTPGYVDPEYVVTEELTEKSDIYSYGVLLLEIITGKKVVEEDTNLVEMSQRFLATKSRYKDLVDPRIKDSIDDDNDVLKQLEAVVKVVRLCTEKEGRLRPSVKQVLRLLCESCDPLHSGFAKAVEVEIGWDSMKRSDVRFQRGENKNFGSSSSVTSRSLCSRSLPHSPVNGLSF